MAVCAAVGSCAYSTRTGTLPSHLKTIAVPVFENKTTEYTLEQISEEGGRFRAEQLYRQRLGPIDERRLFEIAHPVIARGHVVVREHHLARDLRVASLVRLPQRRTAERG